MERNGLCEDMFGTGEQEWTCQGKGGGRGAGLLASAAKPHWRL